MRIKHTNIFEGEFVFIFEEININFSNNSKTNLYKKKPPYGVFTLCRVALYVPFSIIVYWLQLQYNFIYDSIYKLHVPYFNIVQVWLLDIQHPTYTYTYYLLFYYYTDT